ncbi:IS5 family transposase [Streptomyces decoyicus]
MARAPAAHLGGRGDGLGSVSSISSSLFCSCSAGGTVTDAEWAVLAPLLPTSNNRCGRWRNHRQVINGIIHRLSTGCQWRKLPERFGAWQTVHKRHQLWSADGTWAKLLQHVQALADAEDAIDWNINVDSKSIRVHQHAAGAPTAPPAPTIRDPRSL